MSAAIALALRFWKPLAVLALAALLVLAYVHWRDVQRDIGAATERAVWQESVARQKAEAASLLASAQERTRLAEKAATEARATQDLKDTQNARLTSENSRLLLAAGRLRDPNAAPARCRDGGGNAASTLATGTGPSDGDGAETSGLLSVPLNDLLRTLLREADEVNDAYGSCRDDLRSRIANH